MIKKARRLVLLGCEVKNFKLLKYWCYFASWWGPTKTYVSHFRAGGRGKIISSALEVWGEIRKFVHIGSTEGSYSKFISFRALRRSGDRFRFGVVHKGSKNADEKSIP